MTPELLKAHAAKRAEEYANPSKLTNLASPVRNIMNRDAEAFLAGHQEGLEIGKLMGEAKAYRLSGMTGA